MPTIPQHSSSAASAAPRQRRSKPSSKSDAADHVRLRSDDVFEISSPAAPALLPRSALSEHDLYSFDSSSHSLDRRLVYISNLPATYPGLGQGPGSGTVVGIVLGVVLGYLLLFWLVVSVIGSRTQQTYIEGDDTEIVVRRQRDSSRRSRRSHRSRREEVSEVSERQPPRREASPPRRTERVIINETTTRREVSRPPRGESSAGPRSPSERRENISINIRESERERRVDGDDVVEVIEENSSVSSPDPKPRRKSGFRAVDPNAYAGGDFPRQDFNKRSSRR